MPSSWSATTINGKSSYWVRLLLSTAPSTAPTITEIVLDQDTVISDEISVREVDLNQTTGRLAFIGTDLPNGIRNVRIAYNYGITSVPTNVAELTGLLASIRAYANITGASYDALTSYTLGNKAVTIGEQYVNVREVVRQFEERIKAILKIIGANFWVV